MLPQVTTLFLENRDRELDDLVKGLGPGINTRITIVDSAGVVGADSEKDTMLMENHRYRPEILQVLEGERGTSLRFSSTVKEEMLYVAVPIRDQGAIKGVLRVSLYLAGFNRHFSRVRNSIVYSAIGLSLLALLAAFVISRSLSRPISDLRIAAGRLASGDFTSRVIIRDSGEIQDLAQSFNFMIGEINTLFTRRFK